MHDIAIKAENLGKKYIIGHHAESGGADDSLKERLLRRAASGIKKAKDAFAGRPIVAGDTIEEFWALRDVSFEVKTGEIVGIVGRNGAGKSTLLKILSRVTEPTQGEAKIRGKVSSLLEVGTGFHPELTGRENIYLNGALLGMSRADIRKHFDEIVSFSGVEQFLDTPVKRYSSGMYVRLAFSVAVHLLSDILIVDEVLAVGDIEFQKKCLGKMEDVAQGQGRTVLFVSHNMGLITSLCKSAIMLDNGRLVMSGTPSEITSNYHTGSSGSPFAVDFESAGRRIGDSMATLLAARIERTDGQPVGEIDIASSFNVVMRYRLHGDFQVRPEPVMQFNASNGQCAFASIGSMQAGENGVYEAVCRVPGNLLNADTYSIDLHLRHSNVIEYLNFTERNALSIVVVEQFEKKMATRNKSFGNLGVVRPDLEWDVRAVG